MKITKHRNFSCEVLLPSCFVIIGYPTRMPCDPKGIPIKIPIVIMCPQSPDWKPFQLFNRLSETKYMCLECKERPRIGTHTTKTHPDHVKAWTNAIVLGDLPLSID